MSKYDNATLIYEQSENDTMERLRRMCAERAPRWFALCEVPYEDEDEAEGCGDGSVMSWGAQFRDHAVLVRPNGNYLGRFRSAESALRLFGRVLDLRLVWVRPASRCDGVP